MKRAKQHLIELPDSTTDAVHKRFSNQESTTVSGTQQRPAPVRLLVTTIETVPHARPTRPTLKVSRPFNVRPIALAPKFLPVEGHVTAFKPIRQRTQTYPNLESTDSAFAKYTPIKTDEIKLDLSQMTQVQIETGNIREIRI
jgi:hypothetical protein